MEHSLTTTAPKHCFFHPCSLWVIFISSTGNKHLESKGCPLNSHCLLYSNQLRTILSLHCPHHLPTPILPLGSCHVCVLVLNFQPQRSCSSSQVQGQPDKALPSHIPCALPRSPGYIPTHLVGQHTKEVGANEIGHTGGQES